MIFIRSSERVTEGGGKRIKYGFQHAIHSTNNYIHKILFETLLAGIVMSILWKSVLLVENRQLFLIFFYR